MYAPNPCTKNIKRLYDVIFFFQDSPMILSSIPSDSFEELKSDEINSASVNDIDLEADATFGLPEYAQDIHNYLKKAEVCGLKFQNYFFMCIFVIYFNIFTEKTQTETTLY